MDTELHTSSTERTIQDTHTSLSEDDTVNLGKSFAAQLQRGDVVALIGDLGAGKTEFVRGVCSYFDVEEIVSSPTYTIINQYTGTLHDAKLCIYHLDLYRIKSKHELDNIGFDECTDTPDSIKLIEWAERANGNMPRSHYSVTFVAEEHGDDNKRLITIKKI
jgi:tRNA threonylcarbamoyladenosine biosynthesis protein TsaE